MAEALLNSENPNAKYTRVMDISVGSQLGAMSDPVNWTSAAFYMRPQVMPILMQAPKGFKFLPDGEGMRRRLKALIEEKAKSITGLNSTLTAEYEEIAVSKSGEVHQTLTKMNRERSNPNFVWNEYRGMPIYKDLSRWMIDLLESPMTGHPGCLKYDSYAQAGYPELLDHYTSMIVLFIQANHNLTGVDYAYLCANMKPVSLANESALEFATARTPVEHAVDFTAITLVSDEVEAVADLAKAYLDSLNKKGYAPSALLPFADKISSELLSDTAAGIGYKGGVDRVASQL
ncbi:virion structural protein [Vibrio phage vB_VpaM_sm033]|nr:virion structural protein [Vibrio phage vB_VpaM_sm033]